MSTCPYSFTRIPLPHANTTPVKCEYCGAIRSLIDRKDERVFPSHARLNGSPVERDHWEYRDGSWQIVRKT